MAPVAHGLLSGHMSDDTTFVPDDWRHASSVFQGNAFRSNLQVVGRLDRFAREELRCSVSQLAVAWALAHPAVHVAIVGSRRTIAFIRDLPVTSPRRHTLCTEPPPSPWRLRLMSLGGVGGVFIERSGLPRTRLVRRRTHVFDKCWLRGGRPGTSRRCRDHRPRAPDHSPPCL